MAVSLTLPPLTALLETNCHSQWREASTAARWFHFAGREAPLEFRAEKLPAIGLQSALPYIY